MATINPCVDAMMQAAPGTTEREALDVLQELEDERQRLVEAGRTANIPEAMRLIAKRKAREKQIAKAIEKRNAVLTAQARNRFRRTVAERVEQGLSRSKAVLSMIEGTVSNITDGRTSVASQRTAAQAKYVQSMLGELEAFDPSIVDEIAPSFGDTFTIAGRAVGILDRNTPLHSRPFLDKVAREMIGMKKGKVQNVTGDKRAAGAAAIMYKYPELLRLDLNANGANIGHRDGWLPQTHDADRMMRMGQKEWTDLIFARLDLDATFSQIGMATDQGNTPEMKAIIADVYKTLVTGIDRDTSPRQGGGYRGPANLARQLGHQRFFIFKDADAWLDYNAKAGHGHVFNAIIANQERGAQAMSTMSMFGPNPRELINSEMARLEKEVRDDPNMTDLQQRREREKLGEGRTAINNAMDIAIGTTAVNTTAARIMSNIRQVQSQAKLTGAVISAISDTATAATNLQYQGHGIFSSYWNTLRQIVKGRGSRGEERALTFLLGEGADGLTDQMTTPYTAEDSMPGRMNMLTVQMMKWSGLSGWTDRGRGGNVRQMAADMGRLSARQWDSLPPKYKRVLKQHGVDSARWDVWRSTAFSGPNGVRYVAPHKIADVPDTALHQFIKDDLEELQAGLGDRELARAEQDARETEWLQNRTDKYHDRLARARERLETRKQGLDDRGRKALGELTERMQSLHDAVSDIREIYLGSMPAGQDIRNRLADDASQGAANMIPQLKEIMPQANPADIAAVRDAAYEVRKLWSADKPPTMKTVLGKINIGIASLANLRPYAASIPGANDILDGIFEGLSTSALHLQPGPAPRAVGRVEGSASARVAALKKDAAQLGRDLAKARDLMDEKFIRQGEQWGAELTAFAERIEESQAARAARGASEAARYDKAVTAFYERARFDIEMTMRRFYADEVNFAIVEMDPVARRYMTAGQEAGTLAGEAIRMVMQFKGFPIAFTHRVLGRAAHGFSPGERLQQGIHIGSMLAGTTVAGAISMYAKDQLRDWGSPPRDPTDFNTAIAAMAQGGGAGLFSDFLFGEANRFGNTFLESLAGPSVGTLSDAWAWAKGGDYRGKEAFDLIYQNTPFVNMWYAKPVMDWLFLNDLREALAPGFQERQRERRAEKYGAM